MQQRWYQVGQTAQFDGAGRAGFLIMIEKKSADAGSKACLHAGQAVFDDDALLWSHAKRCGGVQIQRRIWFKQAAVISAE